MGAFEVGLNAFGILTWPQAYAYGGLNKKRLYRLICLNTWSSVVGRIRRCGIVHEIVSWGQTLDPLHSASS